jgi:hypothetical protein
MVIETPQGFLQAHPCVAIGRQAGAEVRKFCAGVRPDPVGAHPGEGAGRRRRSEAGRSLVRARAGAGVSARTTPRSPSSTRATSSPAPCSRASGRSPRASRQLADLERAGAADFPYRYEPARGARVCLFIELLKHIKGKWARTPIRLEAWQVFILMTVFSWVWATRPCRPRDRRAGRDPALPHGYVEVPRKNAKSTLTSGIGLYMLALDGEGGAECYSAATTRDQAKIVWNDARTMALRCESTATASASRSARTRSRARVVVEVRAARRGRRFARRPERALRRDRRAACAQDARPLDVHRDRNGLAHAVAALGDHDGRLESRRHLLRAAHVPDEAARGHCG